MPPVAEIAGRASLVLGAGLAATAQLQQQRRQPQLQRDAGVVVKGTTSPALLFPDVSGSTAPHCAGLNTGVLLGNALL